MVRSAIIFKDSNYSEFWDHRARLNVAIFATDYKDIHLDFQDPLNALIVETINGANKAEVDGLELDLAMNPIAGLVVSLSYSYLDSFMPLQPNPLDNGALNIESSEVKFKLNEKGIPVGTYLKVSKEAHQLVEEFMLLANKYVAIKMGKPEKNKLISPFIYRIHDDPNEEKLNDLKIYLHSMGYELIRTKNKPISFSLNEVMEKAKKRKELQLVSPMVIRSMSKAVYSSENIGHYGLSFQYYTHFTSPIRRYADLIVHRKLFSSLGEKQVHTKDQLEHTCNHISKMEKQAVDAERASIKYMQVMYLKEKIGEQFKGMISGLTDWGIYVELEENKCEGMIPLNSMKDDQYYYDSEKKITSGYGSKKTYKMGQEIKVMVKKADLHKRQIDFKIIN